MGFRRIITNRETLVLGGKSAANNEELVKQIEKEEWVFHTDSPGSPFVNIKGKARKGDIKDAAIFCAAYSKDWKNNKLDVVVHKFKGKDIYKLGNMKIGTFGVMKIKKIKIKKDEIQRFLKEWGK